VDLVLPASTGHEVIAAVKRRPTGIKVIATTAFLKQTQLEIMKYLGADAGP
jgi:CheY-like chemotaxis protein